MIGGIRKIALIMMFSFMFLSLGLVYWQVVNADTMLDNPANRRAIIMEKRILRGGIYDHNGVVLAETQIHNQVKQRVYPHGEMFQPLLGYATLKYGSAGLEATLAESLLGLNNKSIARKMQNTFDLERVGNDVILTLDARLQEAAYNGLKGRPGAAVAIDPRTGNVLALVSQPSFDANTLDKDWEQILKKEGSPLLNHAFALFPPGSTMKVITAAALFRSGQDMSDLYHCEGSTIINGQIIQDGRAHGWVNLDLALAYSCNTYFAVNATQAGQQSFLNAVKGFDFGQRIPFTLYIPPSSITREDALPEELSLNLLAESAFGQGQVMISPFHMALITAGIANDGKIMAPKLIDRVLDPKQNMIYKRQPELWLTALTVEEAQKVKSGMIVAVNEGTASPGAIPGIQVAAKTGSAETGGNKRAHAWYIAFAPADDPQIAVAILVEHGGTGGGAAAPIAKAIIEKALERKEGDHIHNKNHQ